MVTSINVSGSRAIRARMRLVSTVTSLMSQRRLLSLEAARRGTWEIVAAVMPLHLLAPSWLPARHRRRPVWAPSRASANASTGPLAAGRVRRSTVRILAASSSSPNGLVR